MLKSILDLNHELISFSCIMEQTGYDGRLPQSSPSADAAGCIFHIISLISKSWCSEKLDVEDHYVAWRQSHDQPHHSYGADGPFSFCTYPFLLNPRAKSKLLHVEARIAMTKVSHTMGNRTAQACLLSSV